MKDFLMDLAIVVVVLVIALPFAIKSCNPNTEEVAIPDTIYIHDTIRIVEPIHIKEEVVRYEKVYLHTTDTIIKTDSVEVIVPIMERVYEDTTYRAVVRGYKPELVSLDIYNSTKTITKTKTKQPKVVVGIGPYAGFGNKGFNYGIAVNVSMPIWSW